MAEASDKYSIIFQNLRDSGLDETTAGNCTEMIIGGDTFQALQIIKNYRKSLLEKIHTNQKKLDCLDFLIYQLGRSEI